MSLEKTVMDELKKAMLAKDQVALRGLRAIKTALLNAKTAEGFSGEITAQDEIKILQKLVKQRKDSLAIFEEQNRPELAKKEEEEILVIEQFLPEQMSEEKIRAVVEEIIARTGASSPADMGKVMGAANKELAGKADGKTIATIVKQQLSAQ